MSYQVQDAGHRRPARQDTFDLRNDIIPDDLNVSHPDSNVYTSDEEHSVMEEDSSGEEGEGEFAEGDDASSSLSIPSEVIDFDLVYSLHTFVATVEGQANVVKGDSLFLMDDSNSYWWLVRVLKTQEIGYIPAENIETPFERLARLNKHRNVDLAAATQAEKQDDVKAARERIRNALLARNQAAGLVSQPSKSVIFTGSSVYNYPPFVWGDPTKSLGEEDHELWEEDDDEYESYEEGIEGELTATIGGMEPDDGMSWEDGAAETQRMSDKGQAAGSYDDTPISLHPATAPVQLLAERIQSPAQPGPSVKSTQLQQAGLGLGLASTLRSQTSRERLSSGSAVPPADPAEVTETRKLTATPSIAREEPSTAQTHPSPQQTPSIQRAASISSAISSVESAGSKRTRDDVGDTDLESKKGRTKPLDKKLRKRSVSGDSRDSEDTITSDRNSSTAPMMEKDKKKKGGMFSVLFKKKDKKDAVRDPKRPLSTGDSDTPARSSADSISSSQPTTSGSDPMITPRRSNSTDPRKPNLTPPPSTDSSSQQAYTRNTDSPVSVHTIRMQQKDQEQQALYQQYLKKSPSSPPDASSSYGTMSAASQHLDNSYNNSLNAQSQSLAPGPRTNRPHSLILTPTSLEGTGPVPDLSVLRVFAGDHLQSEATFKTVLINASTTASDLVRQAMQRFRLPNGDIESDYYLTIKQIGGDEAVLRPDEYPLGAFDHLVERAMSIPTVKRSSVGSISSLVSNLSMHPAITKLGMNDFTDDSAVKFYLHRARKSSDPAGDESSRMDLSRESNHQSLLGIDDNGKASNRPLLSVSTAGAGPGSVSPERFSSPSARFSIQVQIYPEDLPDGMVFDPHTEAIVPRATLQNRSGSAATASPGVSQTRRRKVFVFPKNTTVAEVIEASLERFGIVEGVVEGGDDVEDKLAKRRSSTRVRYGLSVHHPDGQQRELQASSKVLEAFHHPPTFKPVDRRSSEIRRRSGDASQILGSLDDIQPGDPYFILRRAVGLRPTNQSRSKLTSSLDEVALQQFHRESASSDNSYLSSNSSFVNRYNGQSAKMSRQDIITAQREVSRANQRAIMSAQSNSEQGIDILLPERGTLRSTRRPDTSVRYSFIHPDGEQFDISEILEEEWNGNEDNGGTPQDHGDGGDLLEGALAKPRNVLQQDIDRVLDKIHGNVPPKVSGNDGRLSLQVQPNRVSNLPVRFDATISDGPPRSLSSTPTNRATPLGTVAPPSLSRSTSPSARSASPPIQPRAGVISNHHQQPSIASVMSDLSAYTASDARISPPPLTVGKDPKEAGKPRVPRYGGDEMGLSRMLAMIDIAASASRPPHPPKPTALDEHYLGTHVSLPDLHPQAREFYGPVLTQLADVDKKLDDLLRLARPEFR